jgi:hypothetical protein
MKQTEHVYNIKLHVVKDSIYLVLMKEDNVMLVTQLVSLVMDQTLINVLSVTQVVF